MDDKTKDMIIENCLILTMVAAATLMGIVLPVVIGLAIGERM